ncbi:MAG: sigma-70 family RNA polymerase sigma factor [Candidatus Sungbacteria bacterium]|uniref:Sigma-70 family RNA polymerase sigma factor n=1 Tax=Candidatus Sungiibacteriota bacterium TaxID=2750080 RepID=A0A931SB83_9BACT|nr:sigma-70 family RNA polymerase sigma factor [Candidatus Sungbacteria bacterium]
MDLDETGSPTGDNGLKDEVLLASSQENPALFAIMVGRYQEAFLRAAMRVVHRREDAEDIVQEAFVKIYKNAHRFVKQEDIEFKSWAYKIVLNTSFTHYQRLKKRGLNQEANGDTMIATVISDGDDVESTVQMKVLVERTLEVLPENLARLLRKHYLEDKAYETIAEEEETTIAAIKMKLYRARKAFRKLFEDKEGSNREKAEKMTFVTNRETL